MNASERYDQATQYLVLAAHSISGASSNLYEFARATQDAFREDADYIPTEEQQERTVEAIDLLGRSLDVLEQVEKWLDRQLEGPETSTEPAPPSSTASGFTAS